MSLNNLKILAYNILKNLEDGLVRDTQVPELGPCSECNNEILSLPLKPFTTLSCAHVFHRHCIEKKIFPTSPSVCPFPDCGKRIETMNTGRDRHSLQSSQSSGTSTVINMLDSGLNLNSPTVDSEIDWNDEEVETQIDHNSKKRANESTSVDSNSSNKKAKKLVKRKDAPILKKLIKELSAPAPQHNTFDSTIVLQAFSEMDINSVNFRNLDDMIVKAEGNNQKTVLEVVRTYYYYGKGCKLWFDHYKKPYNDESANSLVNEKIREHIPDQDKITNANIRKRKERAVKIFKLFDGIGGMKKINCIKTFNASSISKLSVDDIDYVVAKVLKPNQ
ncbi:hypothetical protein RhiirA1_395233 [Rhizophagus irregularis]|uniref:RING-type domain-containing protein n=2 Tax=Rhizophagus irregularis TaxID=588596 RepID=A0A2N0RQA4_9GLOM|nr:hypothetical protein RhiirA1_395233 [Rhizophagus irregularis]CAB4481491.1 unnamed protein product [Rhizophagus irregularis]